ncbi:MAG: hypothetical protein O2971_05905 [Proteobacteria bacterium]|nr:hypothetical protein [Pseudomonadota bacterium]
MTHNYFSECDEPEAQSELNLYPGGAAILEEFVWDEDSNSEESIIYDGEWREADSLVILELFDREETRFSINPKEGENNIGAYAGVELHPILTQNLQ